MSVSKLIYSLLIGKYSNIHDDKIFIMYIFIVKIKIFGPSSRFFHIDCRQTVGFVQSLSIVFGRGHSLSGGEGLECVVFVVTYFSLFNALFSLPIITP